ncbi:hypothetical protein CTRI78_v006991 [Colletotrichum trifolii]|uniref:Uncharacterized protein n=1 Tax=Colletotrichum trifolii TaxID=5466 RepID=A0A4R8RF15_COLTR|nr:hypothetical protein CTRI78_v006991 [Colletotrichum trifolii]
MRWILSMKILKVKSPEAKSTEAKILKVKILKVKILEVKSPESKSQKTSKSRLNQRRTGNQTVTPGTLTASEGGIEITHGRGDQRMPNFRQRLQVEAKRNLTHIIKSIASPEGFCLTRETGEIAANYDHYDFPEPLGALIKYMHITLAMEPLNCMADTIFYHCRSAVVYRMFREICQAVDKPGTRVRRLVYDVFQDIPNIGSSGQLPEPEVMVKYFVVEYVPKRLRRIEACLRRGRVADQAMAAWNLGALLCLPCEDYFDQVLYMAEDVQEEAINALSQSNADDQTYFSTWAQILGDIIIRPLFHNYSFELAGEIEGDIESFCDENGFEVLLTRIESRPTSQMGDGFELF